MNSDQLVAVNDRSISGWDSAGKGIGRTIAERYSEEGAIKYAIVWKKGTIDERSID